MPSWSRNQTLSLISPALAGRFFTTSTNWVYPFIYISMGQLDYKESWAQKNWCFWTVVLEKTLESPMYFKEIQPVNPKGNQSWIFIGKNDAEAETPIFWPPDVKNLLIWKDPDAGKDWRWEEKGMTEDEMVRWHHWLNGHEFEQALGVGDGQGGLVCCSPWGRKELDMTEQLNWTELNRRYQGPAFLKCHRDSGAGERHIMWKPPPDHGSSLTFCLWLVLGDFLELMDMRNNFLPTFLPLSWPGTLCHVIHLSLASFLPFLDNTFCAWQSHL